LAQIWIITASNRRQARYIRNFSAVVYLAADGGTSPWATDTGWAADTSWLVAAPWAQARGGDGI
jgi:hypothetical protein